MNKKPRVKYNFQMTLPKGRFTMKDVMAQNPGVLYITLHMRLKKMLSLNELKLSGKEHDGKTQGASQKVYEAVTVKKTKKVKGYVHDTSVAWPGPGFSDRTEKKLVMA